MFERDKIFVHQRRAFYEEHYRGKEPIDAWHDYSQNAVHTISREWYYRFGKTCGHRLLNAGSGGSDYGIREPMTHLDLFESKIAHHPEYLVGDISGIPALDGSFDVVLCVGSVLNYADPLVAIREFARVLRVGGVLILEYERSESPEYSSEPGFSRNCCRVKTYYGNAPTYLWVYGDSFIDGLLTASRFGVRAERRFHALSSMVYAITKSVSLASKFTFGDRVIAQFWPLRAFACNRMLAVEKLGDQGD